MMRSSFAAAPPPKMMRSSVAPRHVSTGNSRAAAVRTQGLQSWIDGLTGASPATPTASTTPSIVGSGTATTSATPPSMAQTFCRGPLQAAVANGSGKPLTKHELGAVKEELEALKALHGFKEPVRSFMDDPETKWRFGGAPDYSLTNLQFVQGRSKGE
jgi:hypothetical protein